MAGILIRDLPSFQLKAVLTPSAAGQHSLELLQHWPEAQHPHWRRVTQLNLDTAGLRTLADFLLTAIGDEQ